MKPFDYYNFLSLCFSSGPVPERREKLLAYLTFSGFEMEKLIRFADNHLILPGLFPALKNIDILSRLDEDVTEHFRNIYTLNKERNRNILEQIHQIERVFRENKIQAIYLKGSGNLLDGLYPDIGTRLLNDIDLLVSESDFENSASLLMDAGYIPKFEYQSGFRKYLKHYPPLFHREFPAIVEIHRLPLNKERMKFLDLDELISGSKKSGEDGPLVPSDKNKLLLNFLHAQLENYGAAFARIRLKDLLDLKYIGERIDPGNLLRFNRLNKRKVNNYLGIFQQTFYSLNENHKTSNSGFYFWRYRKNLQSRSFQKINSLLVKMYLAYIARIPGLFSNPYERHLLSIKFKKEKWFRNHLKRLFHA